MLSIRELPGATVEIAWPVEHAGYGLEHTDNPGAPASWRAALDPVIHSGTHFYARVQAATGSRFYRLRASTESGPATIVETSPAFGESGVSVTRESVFRLSAPLATDAIVSREQVYAEFGARRLLSRIELSADRKTVTLFYLEYLPASARIRVSFHGERVKTATGADLDADRDGRPGGIRVLEFETSSTTGLPNTAVIGHVYASVEAPGGENQPLENVTITVDGAEEVLRTTTDATGFFKLQPAPAGRFFVHVDGRTAVGSAWPGGSYYPFVGKAWEAVPGRTNNLASGPGEIFLPLVPADALQAVSSVAATRVTFSPSVLSTNPALAGVEIVVPPDSLFSENGARGGSVGLAAVPPDRLPEPLPPGLNLPLVITIQTDGAMNFDRPVPVRFPNLPDPLTGEKLPPGAKTALWSFNHDTGQWEIQGPATVTADGNFAESDLGVGVRQPGWHGIGVGSSGGGGPGGDDDGDDNDDDETDDDDDDDIDPCKKQRDLAESALAQCVGDVHGTISELLIEKTLGSIPLIGCVFSIAQGVTGAVADCDIDFETCDNTIIGQTAGTLLGCVPVVGGFGSFLYDCLYQTSQADRVYRDCYKRFNRFNRAVALPQSASDIPDDIFIEQAQLWADAAALYALVLGDVRWTLIDPQDWPSAYYIFQALQASIQPGGPGGDRIILSERNAIAALPRPAGIAATNVLALIDRFDQMLAGSPPADFNPAAMGAAAAKLEATALELQRRGWETTYDGLIFALTRWSQEESSIVDGVRLGGGSAGLNPATAPAALTQTSQPKRLKLVTSPLYYKLTDMFGQFVRRGTTSPQGTINNLIVRPDTLYSIEYYDPESMQRGNSFFISAPNGRSFRLPNFILLAVELPDTDQDSLPDEAEQIVGTDPSSADSDGDGASDGEELANGLNPLDGIPQTLGPLASVGLAGIAYTLAVQRDIAAVAGTGLGLTLVDVRNPEQPAVLSRFEEQNNLAALGMEWPYVLTANTSRGLTLLNVQNPAAPAVLWRTNASAPVSSVALGFGHAYVAEDRLRVYELDSGLILHEVPANGYQTVRISGERLFTIRRTANQGFFLDLFRLEESWTRLSLESSVPLTGRISPEEVSTPLLVAGGYAYAGFFEGYQVIDVRDPAAPAVVGKSDRIQPVIHALNLDGSSQLATVTSFAGPDTLQVSLYDASRPTATTNLLATFDTPGNPRKLSLYRGQMLIADESAGLTVANYRAAQTGTNPPSLNLVALSRFRDPPIHPSGDMLRLESNAQDDVLVREVDFYVDGVLANRTGSYPFVAEVRAPELSPAKQSFTVRARATDTQGNSAWSTPVTIGLTHEQRRPLLLSLAPTAGSMHVSGADLEVLAAFNESMALPALTAAWTLRGLGADRRMGTPDDVLIATTASQTGATNYQLQFPQPLPDGFYLVQLTTNATDRFGNRLLNPASRQFGLRPRLTFIGTNDLWTQAATSRTNWSHGALPTTNDFVDIDLPAGRLLRARQNVAAYRLTARTPMAFEGLVDQGFSGELRLIDQAIFEQPVTLHGQVEWIGGSSDILASLDFVGAHNKFLDAHTLNNYGRVTMYGSPESANGLLLRRSALIRNLSGATWDHFGGNIVGGTFENHALFTKHGTNILRVEMESFVNLGTVEVLGGMLHLQGGSLTGNWHQHLGSCRVDPGAHLLFGSEFTHYGPSARVFGGGVLEFGAAREETLFPGTIEIDGQVILDPGPRRKLHFTGPIHSGGAWRIVAGEVELSGLAQRIKGSVTVELNGLLNVSTPAPLVLSSLVVSNDLVVSTALRVDGPLFLDEAVLSGFGRLRANGPTSFNRRIGGFAGPTQVYGSFELAGSAVCGPGARVNVNAYDLTILASAALDLGTAESLRFGPRPIVNHGSILKTDAGVTRVLNTLHNRGLLRVTDGSLEFEQAGLLQTAGLTTLNTTGIVFRLPAGATRGDRFVNLQGGRFEGNSIVVCGSVTNSAAVAPGLPIGKLDFQVGTRPLDSVYLQTASGSLLIDIAGPAAGVGHDQVAVTGRALLDGALEISLSSTYQPSIGDEFTILTASQVQGQFTSVRGATIDSGKRFDVLYEGQAVKLRVTADSADDAGFAPEIPRVSVR